MKIGVAFKEPTLSIQSKLSKFKDKVFVLFLFARLVFKVKPDIFFIYA